MPKSKPQVAIRFNALDDLRRLPGNIRRRLIVEMDRLEEDPRPGNSKCLTIKNEEREIRRLRIDRWRVVYWVRDEQLIVFAIRKRPPYDYEDLPNLLKGL